ncbi:hypothetical protein [Hymenobacter terrestris]|uniref:Uncharacterized protein n=1 Tax=Hymenobacter terrestris TaxID=2748310 RepID=A0ABX2Q6M5_9BACT|nr:hypothetical protein [Hymenobacter terrestris]NVO85407.1 hypothetical protein [Hymenobacter terrestris]
MPIFHVPEQSGEPRDKGGFLFQALAWVLLRVVPKASPDYEKRLALVEYWLVEVNEEGAALREIGFTAAHQPVLFAPTNRNYGLWTDSDRVFSPEEFTSRNDFPFDATWNRLYGQTSEGARSL